MTKRKHSHTRALGAEDRSGRASEKAQPSQDIGLEYSNISPDLAWGSSDMRPRTLRRLFGNYPTGVAVVTARAVDGRRVGLTINSFASLSLDPPLVLWSLADHSSNLSAFRGCSHFVINVLSSAQEALARRFANSRLVDKFADVALREAPEGVPLLDGALTALVCAHDHSRTVGDHLLLIGRVIRTVSQPGEPLLFHAGRFVELPRQPRGAKIALDNSPRPRTPRGRRDPSRDGAPAPSDWDSPHVIGTLMTD